MATTRAAWEEDRTAMRARLRQVGRASAYLLLGVATGLLAWVVAGGIAVALLLVPLLIGLTQLPWAVRGLRWLSGLERRRAAWLLGEPVPERYLPLDGPLRQQLGRAVNDPATYRDVAWLLLHGAAGFVVGVAVLGLWLNVPVLLSVPAWWWAVPPGTDIAVSDVLPLPSSPAGQGLRINDVLIDSWPRALTVAPLLAAYHLAVLVVVVPWLARGYTWLARWLLAPSARTRLAARVEELTETRAGAVDAHGAELRRIERDLHDGTQARLVAIGLRLGLAKQGIADDPQRAARLLGDAEADTQAAMAELRQVVRGIYPPVLSDRGLDGAVTALVAGAAVPVRTEVAPVGRLPAAVEAAAYFTIAEALSNVAKHSQATRAWVQVRRGGDTLQVVVGDDGRGGAAEQDGTGLAGIRRRVAALDGHTRLSSPPGGPTELTVELPCGS
jgi:signal transduction histidine kinase